MYRLFSVDDYKLHLNLPKEYAISGLMVYGTYKKHPFEQFENSIKSIGAEYKKNELKHEFFNSLIEYEIDKSKYWVVLAYGGALLSEYTHLACLLGSKHNLLIGSCGGLKKGSKTLEVIIPTYSHSVDSSATAYNPGSHGKFYSDKALSKKLTKSISRKHKVHIGPTITFQAMMAETPELITQWSNEGYVGVEMEIATVFSVSNHFKVPSAAMLMIGDNLIEGETVLDINYENNLKKRRLLGQDLFDTALGILIA